jgi:hypothetical protein
MSISNDYNVNDEGFTRVSLFYSRDVSLAAVYRSIIGTKADGLVSLIGNKSAITVFICKNIFPISFTSFYTL